MEITETDEPSSLLWYVINYRRKKFKVQALGVFAMKKNFFFFFANAQKNSLGCLSLTGLFSYV